MRFIGEREELCAPSLEFPSFLYYRHRHILKYFLEYTIVRESRHQSASPLHFLNLKISFSLLLLLLLRTYICLWRLQMLRFRSLDKLKYFLIFTWTPGIQFPFYTTRNENFFIELLKFEKYERKSRFESYEIWEVFCWCADF